MPVPTVSYKVYRKLREQLATGKLLPGTRLSEVALAKEFGTSRAPIREAIKDLVAEGFIDQIPNTGSFVRKANRTDLVGLFELREWIECGAVSKAVKWIDQLHLDKLERSCKDLHELAYTYRDTGLPIAQGEMGIQQEGLELDFHLTLLSAAGNLRAVEIVENQRMLSRTWLIAPVTQDWSDLLRQAREHEEVLRAVRSGDVQAAQAALRHHITAGREATLSSYDRKQQKLGMEKRQKQQKGMLRMDLAEEIKKGPTMKGPTISGISGLTTTGPTIEKTGN